MYPVNETTEKPLKFRMGMIILFSVATLWFIPQLIYAFDCTHLVDIIYYLLNFSLPVLLTIYSAFLYKKIKPKVVFTAVTGALMILYVIHNIILLSLRYGYAITAIDLIIFTITVTIFTLANIFVMKEKSSKLFVIIAFCVAFATTLYIAIRFPWYYMFPISEFISSIRYGSISYMIRTFFDLPVYDFAFLTGLFLLGLASCNDKAKVTADANYGAPAYDMNYGVQNYGQQNSMASNYEAPNYGGQYYAPQNNTVPTYEAPVYTAPTCNAPSQYTPVNDVQTPAPSASSADEILKFKQLLDQGAITQEEYDAKKKQLLGL